MMNSSHDDPVWAQLNSESMPTDDAAPYDALTPEQRQRLVGERRFEQNLGAFVEAHGTCPDLLWHRLKAEMTQQMQTHPQHTRRSVARRVLVPLAAAAILVCISSALTGLLVTHFGSERAYAPATLPQNSLQQFEGFSYPALVKLNAQKTASDSPLAKQLSDAQAALARAQAERNALAAERDAVRASLQATSLQLEQARSEANELRLNLANAIAEGGADRREADDLKQTASRADSSSAMSLRDLTDAGSTGITQSPSNDKDGASATDTEE